MPNSDRDLLLRSERLEVALSPEFGGGLTGIRDRSSGGQVLWRTPWADETPVPPRDRPLDVDTWVRHSRGGWQVLLPNGGDDCDWHGVRHGFHGEATVIAWRVLRQSGASATLAAALSATPIDVERTVTATGADVVVTERLSNRSAQPVDLMWTHHPGFGGDLLAGPVRLDTNAGAFQLDDRAPVVGLPATPGDAGRWPWVGTVDLRHPRDGSALLGYLSDFDGDPWVRLARADGSLGVRLGWDAATFPRCWLWQELGGTTGSPWHGAVRVIGVEPATSWPGQGLARAAGTTFRLAGHGTTTTSVTLTVLTADDTASAPGESA
ncbi:MAG TPA: DUF4432 family protein [Mycobacteriales bacterium]|nr:DUF4432 family protein [Mycobacteriales bacterium]